MIGKEKCSVKKSVNRMKKKIIKERVYNRCVMIGGSII